jgi:hypothetical protein
MIHPQRDNLVAKRFWKSAHFQELQDKWYDKLKTNGFKDIETKGERLIEPDRRTIAFENRDEIAEFFRRLDHYLSNNSLPKRERRILELYSQGIKVKSIHTVAITNKVNLSDRTVRRIITKHKRIILKG